MILRRNYLLMLLVPILCFSSSCEKLLEVESRHIVEEENKWKDINDARASLLGVYGLLRSALAENNAFWLYGDLRQGDFISTSRRDLEEIIQGNLNSSYATIEDLSNWRRFYAVINAANIFIERSGEIVEHDAQYTASNHRIDVAQARAIKGFTYFLLARIWGDVPIWEKSYEGTFPKLPSSESSAVLAYAERELKAAADILPFRYGFLTDEIFPTQEYYGESFGSWAGVLFNRVSVNAILAHLAAWSGNYFESSIYSEYVISNSAKAGASYVTAFDLVKNDGFFYTSSGSHLVAFPFKYQFLESGFKGHIEELTLAAPYVPKASPEIYVETDRIVSIFNESGDQRFSIAGNGSSSSTYFSQLGTTTPIFSKINSILDGTSPNSNFPLFSSAIVFSRLEDIALLRAEALAVIGETEDARNILNQLRRTRGLSDAPSNRDLIDQIFEERRKELMGEGSRWFDLVRYHKIKRNNTAFNTLIDQKGIYWPVAEEVLMNNNNLKQNPYWN